MPTEVIVVYDDGQRLQGRLHTVSETGGCAGMEAQLPPSTLVSIELRTSAGLIKAVAEMLHPLDACRQPFRFLAIDEPDRNRLQQMMKS